MEKALPKHVRPERSFGTDVRFALIYWWKEGTMRAYFFGVIAALGMAASTSPVAAQMIRPTFVVPPRPIVNSTVNSQNTTTLNIQSLNMFRPAFFNSVNINSNLLMQRRMHFLHWQWHRAMAMYLNRLAYGGYGGYGGYGLNLYGLGDYAPYTGMYSSSYAGSSTPYAGNGGYKSSYSEKKTDYESMFGSESRSGYGAEKPSTNAPQAESAVNVAVFDGYYEPKEVTVPVGTTVRWTNLGQDRHSITFDDGLHDSGKLNVQTNYTRKFNEPGTFSYHCDKHPEMRGKVIVR
jgi:plastocyanin